MNDQFTKELVDTHGDAVARKLADQKILTHEQALSALSSISPVILGSLKRKQEEVGAGGIEELLEKAGITGDDVDNIDDVLDKGLAGHTSKTSAVIDSSTQDVAAQALSQKFNIGGAMAKKLIPMLAPIIIGMLVKKGGQKTSGESSSGGLAGGIGAILDRDGDGSVIDDIAGMVLGQKSTAEKKGGFLQWLISLIFRKK